MQCTIEIISVLIHIAFLTVGALLLECDNNYGNSSFCSKVECEPISCDDGTLVERKAGPCSCCSACFQFAELDQYCTTDLFNDPLETIDYSCSRIENQNTMNICKPGLKCKTETTVDKNKCVFEGPNCLEELKKYEQGQKEPWMWKPDCDAEWKFNPKQCKGNKCFCRMPDNNQRRLFGDAIRGDTEEQQMNCACALMDVHLLGLSFDSNKKNLIFDHVICETNGNYMLLQCLRNLCFCINVTSGEVNGVVLPKELISLLPCYDENTYSKTYDRPCQQQRQNDETVVIYYYKKGFFDPRQMPLTQCEASGGHIAKQCDGGKCYCADTEGTNLATGNSVEIGTADATTMTCYCARDATEAGVSGGTSNLQCLPNGNYKPRQCTGKVCYCVDEDGQQCTDSLPSDTVIDCEKRGCQ